MIDTTDLLMQLVVAVLIIGIPVSLYLYCARLDKEKWKAMNI